MNITKTQSFKLTLYVVVLYGILLIQIALSKNISSAIFSLLFLISAIVLLRYFFSKNKKTNKGQNTLLIIVLSFIASFLIVFPLYNFLTAIVFSTSHSVTPSLELLLASAYFSIIPSIVIAGSITLIRLVYISIKKIARHSKREGKLR